MSKQYAVKAEKRERAGKGIARTLRREGKLPGVIYGDSKTPVLISFSANDIQKEWLKGRMFTSLCELNVDGEKNLVLARDVQLHPVTDRVEHVDFLRVSPKTTLDVSVPVHFINHENSPGLKEKGILTIAHHSIEMVCRATEIPESIEIDLAPFKMNDTITLADVKLPAGAKVADAKLAIASITPPKGAATEDAAPAAAAAPAKDAKAPAKDAKAPAKDAKAPAAKK